MKPFQLQIYTILTLITYVTANVEKIIFLSPSPTSLPHLPPLDTLDPTSTPSLRTNLSRLFPSPEDGRHPQPPPGQASWFLLHGLAPHQRFELRICWAAIEPTQFTLAVHTPDHVVRTPGLTASLAGYVSGREKAKGTTPAPAPALSTSALLLQVHAAADYFSHDGALMRSPPPPVLVDLVLDPLLPLSLPRSLVPVGAYLVVVAITTFFVARWIADVMTSIADVGVGGGASESKKKD